DVLLLVLGELREAATGASLRHPRARRALLLLLSLPAHAIREIEGLARRGQLLRHPVRNDVVVGLVRRAQRDELDSTRCPGSRRLDPRARPQLVTRFAVLVVVELAVALHEAEAAQLLHRI